jgi:osmoprotectant transport system substrate-binding protein
MKRGLPVDLLPKLGSREIVEPALEQGRVNFVPEYMGTSLDFLSRDTHAATADAPATYAKLRAALASRGIVALRYAPGQDANGFAVTAATARRLHLRRLSDLAPIASQLVFGGPPECPSRPLCLAGLQDRYGLHFKQFKPMPTRSVTADALEMGEIDIGLLETTNGNLATRQFTLLEDDRGLQPAENVVPIARRALVDAYGAELTAPVDAITARLTTATLAGLNQRVEVGHEAPAQVAADWLQREGLAA